MQFLENNQEITESRIKRVCRAALVMALMSTTSVYAMSDVDEEGKRVRCLWQMGTKHRESALEILKKRALQGDHKARIQYLKKLGEFLKEDPIIAFGFPVAKGSPVDKAFLSSFYEDTLGTISGDQNLSDSEKDFEILKLKIFYRRLPQQLVQRDPQVMEKETTQTIRKFRGDPKTASSLLHKLSYLQKFYKSQAAQAEDLEEIAENALNDALTVQSQGKTDEALTLRRFAARIYFKVAHDVTLKTDIKKMIAGYRKSAGLGYIPAKYALAELYNDKSSSSYDLEKAFDLYSEAAHGKHPLAAYRIATLQEQGDEELGLSSEKDKAIEWHEVAAKQGHPLSQYALAHMVHDQERDVSLNLLTQSAESGYRKAQLELAQFYEGKDPVRSLYWYEKAASQGEVEAYYPLGYAYEKGICTTQDYKKASAFYELGLGEQASDPRVLIRLGKMYLKGKAYHKGSDVPQQSDVMALNFFQKASSQSGYGSGNYYVGLMALRGQGYAQPDLKTAIDHFKAAGENHPKALTQLGLIKLQGIGTNKNNAEARSFFERAGDYPEALYQLGRLYAAGLGGEQNQEEAMRLWGRAAELGHKEALLIMRKIRVQQEELTRLREAHATQGATLAEKETLLTQKQGELQTKSQLLEQLQADLTAAREASAARPAVSAEQPEGLNRQRTEQQAPQGQVAQPQEAALDQQPTALTEREAALTTAQNALAAKEAKLATAQTEFTKKQNELDARKTELAKKEGSLAEKLKILADEKAKPKTWISITKQEYLAQEKKGNKNIKQETKKHSTVYSNGKSHITKEAYDCLSSLAKKGFKVKKNVTMTVTSHAMLI